MQKVIIIEPHHDDAIYSIGGIILRFKKIVNFHLITVFSDSIIFNPNYKPKDSLESIRTKETQKVINELDIGWTCLGFKDEDLSRNKINQIEFFDKILKKLKPIIHDKDIVFLPAGFGDNPHHILISWLKSSFNNHLLYEDTTPVIAYSRILDSFMPLYNELFNNYEAFYIDITNQIEYKIRLASYYESQFSGKSCKTLKPHARNIADFAKHTDYCDNSLKYAERIYIPRNNSLKIKQVLLSTIKKIDINKTIKLIPKSFEHYNTRKTRRNLFGTEISFEEVSNLLQTSVSKIDSFYYLKETYSHMPYPTAGGLENSEIFLISFNIKELKQGIYRLDTHKNDLTLFKDDIDIIEFTEIIENQEWGLGASFAIIVNSKNTKLFKKYGSRANQLALLEAGHLCQNLLLSAEKLDISAVEIGGFSKQRIIDRYNIFNPVVLILFSKYNTKIEKVSIRKVPYKSIFNKTEYRDLMSFPYSVRTKIYKLNNIKILISRAKIPIKNHDATGVSFCFNNQKIEDAEKKAMNKAISEADEIFNSFNVVPNSLVFTSINKLRKNSNDLIITPDKIILDSIQKQKLDNLIEQNTNNDSNYHFIRGVDLFNGESLWCHADAVLIGKRFWDQKIWPTSTGYGCANNIETALKHSLCEIIEKVIVPEYLQVKEYINFDIENVNVIKVISTLKKEIKDLKIYSTKLAPFVYILFVSNEMNIFGSSVSELLDNALIGASEEITAKLLQGSNENQPSLLGKMKYKKGLQEFLNENGLSIGYTYFISTMINTNIITKAFLYEHK